MAMGCVASSLPFNAFASTSSLPPDQHQHCIRLHRRHYLQYAMGGIIVAATLIIIILALIVIEEATTDAVGRS